MIRCWRLMITAFRHSVSVRRQSMPEVTEDSRHAMPFIAVGRVTAYTDAISPLSRFSNFLEKHSISASRLSRSGYHAAERAENVEARRFEVIGSGELRCVDVAHQAIKSMRSATARSTSYAMMKITLRRFR